MYKYVDKLARGCALLGGSALLVLILMVCVSIIGRSLNGVLHLDSVQSALPATAAWLLNVGIGPVNGDYELVEAGMAFTVFAFLPICQLHVAHASVNILNAVLSSRVKRVLAFVTDVVFALVLVIIAWKLFEGMESKRSSQQVTFLLQYPLWWAYACSLLGATAAALIGVYMAVMRFLELAFRRDLLPVGTGSSH
ncbi:MAG: TRAP transporter small permease [Granulosicoccus sp.]